MSIKLPTTENMQLKIEDGVSQTGPQLMTNSGDNRTFTCGASRFSLCESDENGLDRRPIVRPDGLRNGCYVEKAASGIADAIDVCQGSLWIAGVLVSVNATTDITVTRPATGSVRIVSVVADSLGNISLLNGTDGSDFSDTRGVAGGAPYVALGEVELATLKLFDVSAPIKNREISFLPELSSIPGFHLHPYEGEIMFDEELPLIHTGVVSKNIYISYCEPVLSVADMFSIIPPTASEEYDPSVDSITPGKMKNGRLHISVSGNQSDLSRRIEKSVRLFEFMPDSSGVRKEYFYAYVENNSSYMAGELMTGDYLLVPVFKPMATNI